MSTVFHNEWTIFDTAATIEAIRVDVEKAANCLALTPIEKEENGWNAVFTTMDQDIHAERLKMLGVMACMGYLTVDSRHNSVDLRIRPDGAVVLHGTGRIALVQERGELTEIEASVIQAAQLNHKRGRETDIKITHVYHPISRRAYPITVDGTILSLD